MSQNMPPAEVGVDAELVAGLLSDQWPDWTGQAPVLFANGWDNTLFRVGESHIVRLPRRSLAAQLVKNEAKWLPLLAPRLPIPIPAPVLAGNPGRGFPWSWNVVPWLPGRSVAESQSLDSKSAAIEMAAFLTALHHPAPEEAPSNPFRGGPLSERDSGFRERVQLLNPSPSVLELWDELSSSPAHSGPAVWLHGDLHPHNLLERDGSLSAVIDFGDITAGDPATDLAVAWMLSPTAVPVVREAYGDEDPSLWRRARAWALHFSLVYLLNSDDNPTMRGIGERTLQAVLEDPV